MLALAALAACGEPRPRVPDLSGPPPQRLSEWRLFSREGDTLRPVAATETFAPANPLFTDYAQKLRALWIPDGKRIGMTDGKLDYPVGTVLSKTFYYPVTAAGAVKALPPREGRSITLGAQRPLETRLLVRRENDWWALAYVWNDDASEAFARVAGADIPLTMAAGGSHSEDTGRDAGEEAGESAGQDAGQAFRFTYFVPNQNQCASCHVTRHPDGGLEPLGAVARQLGSQTAAWAARGWVAEPPAAGNGLAERPAAGNGLAQPPAARGGSVPTAAASYLDGEASLDVRAAEYLNIHCGHCHNPAGAADTSGLFLDGSHRQPVAMGVCKPPVAAGRGSGGLRFNIEPGLPAESILLYRMGSTAADEMMPELGRSLVDREGIALISAWIASLPGSCAA